MRHPDDFVSRVIGVVESIPPGRVMTYGDVAAAIGSRGARAVGGVLAHYGSTLPWWRVIRASGHPAAGHEAEALERLRVEGTPLAPSSRGARVRLDAARYTPE